MGQGYQIELEDQFHQDTDIPAYRDTPISYSEPQTHNIHGRPGNGAYIRGVGNEAQNVPSQILEMRKLYQYDGGSFHQKCQNFYRQGKFMEDYEDDAPLPGNYRHYFTTYHDLNIRQLRGYFTWRKLARKGDFKPIAISLAYMYLYELLCGIGTRSHEDALVKMEAFERGFLDAGFGDERMRTNLHHWMFDYAVIHNMPGGTTEQFADPAALLTDRSLSVLKNPESYTDGEIVDAMSFLDGSGLKTSPVFAKSADKGNHLFASAWRIASGRPMLSDDDIFTACFGREKAFAYHPLANAVYWEPYPQPDCVYECGPCRTYTCRNGEWTVTRYDKLYFDREKFHGFLHEADALFRRYLRTSRYLHGNEQEQWARPFIIKAIEEEKRAEEEASKPVIRIDFSSLDRIREDAAVTRDSLLTEDMSRESSGTTEDQTVQEGAVSEEMAGFNRVLKEKIRQVEPNDGRELPEHIDTKDLSLSGFWKDLNPRYREILKMILSGNDPAEYIRACHLMPSVVTDSINEAFYDEIGDNILECSDNRISLVEDYRNDVIRLTGDK